MKLFYNAYVFLSMLNQSLKVSTAIALEPEYNTFLLLKPVVLEMFQPQDAYRRSRIRQAGTRAFSICHGACYKTQTGDRLAGLCPEILVPRRTSHQIVFENPMGVWTGIWLRYY